MSWRICTGMRGVGARAAGLRVRATWVARRRADAVRDRYRPISERSGRSLYALGRATQPATIVEFGMSGAISTLHLAAAVRDNGGRHVFTTELNAKKVAVASQVFAAAGVGDIVTILDGEAFDALGEDAGGVGQELRDGWRDLYLSAATADRTATAQWCADRRWQYRQS